MQNTILIHAPGRRQGRGALVLAYTALFALLMGIWAAIFALNGQSFIQYGDTLKQHYPFLVYYGRWLKQASPSSWRTRTPPRETLTPPGLSAR